MKSIEERAEEYLDKERLTIARMCEAYDLPKEARQTVSYHRYHDYIVGATEQKAIDEADYTEQMRQLNEEWKGNLAIQRLMLIDKACGILREAGVFAWLATSEEVSEEMAEKAFRKMMGDSK